ncbi:MAG: glutamyl-tRNA reductase [Thermoleophilia bacterium]|nr:glutamyl-tRNA reductase [Thermoleophilia bacterium]
MHVTVVGLSHKTAPVEQREKATLADRGARELMNALVAHESVAEAVALSTCNRTEIYAVVRDPLEAEPLILDALVDHTRIGRDELDCARYTRRDERATSQLFRVVSSLDSMVVGESEIQGQVRAAWDRAREEGAAGPILNQLFRRALEVGKRVRSETRISAGPSSVSTVAVNVACDAFRELSGRSVLVIGAGKMAEGTMVNLVERGAQDVVVINRTVTTARALAARVGGRGGGFADLDAELAAADIVISSTNAPHPVLMAEHLQPIMGTRPDRPLVVIDISVPRDVDPGVRDIPGVVLHDIDDLEQVVEANMNGRRREALHGERVVHEAVDAFAEWRSGLAASPAIRGLRDRAEEIRRGELQRMEGVWDSLSDADRERLEALTRSIVNKLLHEPTVRARAAVREAEGLRHLESLQHLFGLERSA